MGTHPIFESDFDCLTEWLLKSRMKKTEPAKGEIGKEFFDKLQDFMQSNFGEKQPRECPECIKCKDDSVPKYFSSLGSLKEHLLEHYKVKYYLENYRNKTKV